LTAPPARPPPVERTAAAGRSDGYVDVVAGEVGELDRERVAVRFAQQQVGGADVDEGAGEVVP
jgi:hypothetical protein